MVKLFTKETTVFSGNGKAVLTPTVCKVREAAGGGYELHMEHPFDQEGRYLLLEAEEIIVAPVPPFRRDAITLPEMTIYIVNTDGTPVYSSLPRTTTDESKVDQIRKVKAAPGDYAWAPGTNYNVGALVTYGGRIYRAKQYNFAVTPGTANQVWGYVTTVAGTYTGDVTTIPGTVVETLPLNAQVFFLADYSQKYIRVRTVQGNEGYIAREKVTVTQDKQSGQVIPAKDITEQAFRIYSVTCEEELGSVVVEARHISYDFAGNALYKCELKQADPATAISMLRGTLMEPDNRVIACDIVTDQKITQDWSFRNPVNALLGQDDGLVPLLDAKLLRDNGDFYILDNSHPRQGITLAYGRNLTGVQWNRNTENVITRIVPRCNLSNGGFLYVDGIFVDSERISDYPVHRIEVMDCGYTIGQKYTPPEGGEDVVWTEEAAKAQMLKDARERFSKQHVDSVSVSLNVEFLLLGDTEEFRQYRGLQRVNLYDEITVITGPSGMKSTAQVTEYEYDCILQRYNSIVVGRVNTFRRVPGFTLTSGSVTYSKLSPELVSLISGGTSTTGSSDDDSQADQPNGGAVLPPMTQVIDDLTHTDTDKALSANMGRELDEGKKDKQEPVTDPTASGTGVQFISSISQDENGVITAAKKTVRTMGGASASADGSSGLVPKPEAGEEEKFLRGDGEWASPAGTYSLPLAADGTRGGVQIGYAQNGKNYPVQLSGEKMFVNVPWTDNDHHAWDDITGKPATATRWPDWSEVTDKPATATRWPKWSEVTEKPTFSGGTTTLAWGTTHTIATVAGSEVKLTMPANPNTDHYAWSDITGKPETATRWPSWSEVTDKPTSFYTLPLAASGTRGGVKIGYTASGKNYPVQLDSNERMYVNVPWTDTDTWRPVQNNLTSTSTSDCLSAAQGKALQDNKLDKATSGGLGEVAGGGSTNYFLLATLTVTQAYIDRPVVFELSRRGYGFQRLMVILKSDSGTDPGLSKFATDGETLGFWIKKSATSTWQIYGKYSESWGNCTVHRITGSVYNNGVNVALNLTNAGNTEPGGTAVARYWSAAYADRAGNIQNNLTSTSTTDSLSAYQGKILQYTKFPYTGGDLYRSTTDTPLYVKSNGNNAFIGFKKSDGTINGYVYVTSNQKAGIYYGGTYHHFALEADAVKSISRNGKTFTATRCDGSTFTFDQQDNDHYDWSDITNKPTSFTPAAHTHSSKDLTNIALTWEGSYSDGDYMLIHNGETGTNGGALFRAINKTNTANWVDGVHKWVRVGGDDMTGNLSISHAGETLVRVTNSDKNVTAYLDVANGGEHGIWSNGYWNGTQFVSSGKWLVYRNNADRVYLEGSAASLRDATNSNAITATYSGSGRTDFDYACVWNGYQISWISKANFKARVDTWRPVQNNLTSTSTTDSLSAYQGNLLASGWARDGRIMRIGLDPGERLTYELTNANGVSIIAWRIGTSGDAGLKIGHAGNYVSIAKTTQDYLTITQNGTTVSVVNGGINYMRGFVIAAVNPNVAPGPM